MDPPLSQTPAGTWQCEICILNRVPPPAVAVPVTLPPAQLTPLMMRRHAAYRRLEGRFIRQIFQDQPHHPYYGVVHYLGPQTLGPGQSLSFGICYDDGDQLLMSKADVDRYMLPSAGPRSKWPSDRAVPGPWRVQV